MKTISLCANFDINDVGNQEKVDSILSDIIIKNDRSVILDLRHCLIDYPATSLLLDTIFNQLSELANRKTFNIYLDYDLPKQTLLNWLFLGSSFFRIEKSKEMLVDELEKILISKIKENEIFLNISIFDISGELKKEYKYE